MSKGLDIGTSYIITAEEAEGGKTSYKEFRDAFFQIKPQSKIQAKMLEKGLAGKSYFKDSDGSLILVGQDAIEKAVEQRLAARRPMYRGVVSPRERDARRILKFILSQILGEGNGEKVVFSVPAQPIDQPDEEFDTGFHEDAMKNDIKELGFDAEPLNEAEAICYAELEDSDYTGLAVSMGAGMQNYCLMSNGERVAAWSVTRSGDWVDRMAAQATGMNDSTVQLEKEHGSFTVGAESPGEPILSAVALYYGRLLDYSTKYLEHYLNSQSQLPKFSQPLPVVLAGGTSQAEGTLEYYKKCLDSLNLPFEVSEVRYAKDQLRAVSLGCLIAASL